MKTYLTPLFLLVSMVVYGFRAEPADSARTAQQFRWLVQVMGFGRNTGFADQPGSINPANRIARLNPYDAGLYIRPDLTYQYGKFSAWVKPRLHLDIPENPLMRGEYMWKENSSSEVFFQELKGRWQLNNKVFIQAGRYLKQIGTSIFLNPSNPFLINTGRLNPKIELIPMDFVEVSYASKKNWTLSLIANLGPGSTPAYQSPFLTFSRTYGVLLERYGDSDNLGLIVSADEAQHYHLGGYGQKNLSDALVVWVDWAANYGINRFYPVEGHTTELLNYEMVNGNANSTLFFTGLAGASYTFTWGPTLQIEYLYNGKGYNRNDYARYQQMIASSRNYTFDVTKELVNLNLGRSIHMGMPYVRKNYVFLQLSQADIGDQLTVNVRNLYSIDDGSNQLSSLIEWNVTDAIELYTIALKEVGAAQKNYRLIDHQIMIGVIAKF